MPKIKNNNQGSAVIILVFVLAMAIVVFGRSLVGRNLDKLNQINLFYQAQQANYIAVACIQNAARRLQLDYSYLANNYNLALPGGICRLTVSANGSERIVAAQAQVGEVFQRLIARFDLAGDNLNLISWQEY